MKSFIANYPHLILLILIPFILLVAFTWSNKSIDLQIHDTYLVIMLLDTGILLSGLLLVQALGYWITLKSRGQLLWNLTLIHAILIIITFLLLFLITEEPRQNTYPPLATLPEQLDSASIFERVMYFLVPFVFSLVVYAFNIATALYRKG